MHPVASPVEVAARLRAEDVPVGLVEDVVLLLAVAVAADGAAPRVVALADPLQLLEPALLEERAGPLLEAAAVVVLGVPGAGGDLHLAFVAEAVQVLVDGDLAQGQCSRALPVEH